MSQDFDFVNRKYRGNIEQFYMALPFQLRTDPENDIVFDEMSPVKPDTQILQGGKARIKFKKLEKFKDEFGQEYQYFDFYTSGDKGRATKRKNSWKKYIWLLGAVILFYIYVLSYYLKNFNFCFRRY